MSTPQDDAFTTDEAHPASGDLFADNGAGPDTDAGGQPLTISSVNGSSANVDRQFALASGALLTVHADGTFQYDPNGAFDALPAAGSGAANTQATDSFTYTLSGGGTATVTLTINGLDSNDTLIGTAGGDILDGGVGVDLMRGLAGDDAYYVDTPDDRIIEDAGMGTDKLFASNSYTLAAGIQIEEMHTGDLLGTLNIGLFGNELVQSLFGNAGANRLDGRGGGDTMTGYGGNDWYYVDNMSDVIVEAANQGYDRLYASASYVIAAGVEIEELHTADSLGTAAINLTGNAVEQYLFGNAGDNRLDGGGGPDIMAGFGGNDWYYVDSRGDVVREDVGAGYDRVYASVNYVLNTGAEIEEIQTSNAAGTTAVNLTGNEFGQYLFGNAGSNRLDGAGGADTMSGFGGDDSYYIDNAMDAIVEASGLGYDRAYTTLSYTLAAGVSVEELYAADPLSTAPIELTGNELHQWLVGNAGANVLRGGGGSGPGFSGYSDVLMGLGGDDTYYAVGAVRIVEAVGGGFDRVYVPNGYFTLSQGAEVEEIHVIRGGQSYVINGNELSQTIFGTIDADRLDGGLLGFTASDPDTLIGYAGNDAYVVHNIADVIVERAGEGYDHVYCTVDYVLTPGADIEDMSVGYWGFGTNLGLHIVGNELDQKIVAGSQGNDIVDGGGGADVLRGNGGSDTFDFSTALGNGNIDLIQDFAVGTDKIGLHGNIFGLSGSLQASQFVTGTAAQDADDRIIYDPATGALYFDADGSGTGAAIQFATMTAHLALTSNDFVFSG